MRSIKDIAFDDSEFFKWYNDESRAILSQYFMEGETVQDCVARICRSASNILDSQGLKIDSQIFYNLIAKGWLVPSTPVWCNMGTLRALPISCYGSVAPDSIAGIFDTCSEVAMMTKMGGGTSVYLGKLRHRGATVKDNGTSNGPVAFSQVFDSTMQIVAQGRARRGSCAVYLDVTHPDIFEFLSIREIGSPIQELSFGVCIPDEFMESLSENKKNQKIWAKILESRIRKGYPYIFFTGNANKNKPDWYKDYPIVASNLCSEIMLPSSEDESFVCCLSHVNLAEYDEWKDTDLVRYAVFFLDAVMSEFIEKSESIPHFERAVKFAKRHRALGLGVVGWHTYLQKHEIPFFSVQSNSLASLIFGQIRETADAASRELSELGEPEVMKGTGRRNSTLLAIAPNVSSAAICGQVSCGIEPILANAYASDQSKGIFSRRNRQLEVTLSKLGLDTDSIWDSIIENQGSVQHIEKLGELRKVYKTFLEISQDGVIRQAAIRTPYIDQGQSLNLIFSSTCPVKEIHNSHILAWQLGVKSLYYLRSVSPARNFSASELTKTSCDSCES